VTPTPRKSRKPTTIKTREAQELACIDAMLGSVYDGLVLIDRAGDIERMNVVAERQLGIAANSAVGKPLAALGLAEFDATARQVLAGQESQALELRVELAGGPALLVCRICRVAGAGVVVVLHDASAQRDFDAMCSEFLLRAAHELRTPIASVRMGLGLLGERLDLPAGSREGELFETVQQELGRMTALISDLLDSSALEQIPAARQRNP